MERPTSLIQPLFDGPLDIVGDLHGEIDPLRSLFNHLGYSSDGKHPDCRRLVFVGDLTDRGPDSPAVADFVQSLVEAGRAQCVLGNHDLNILLGHRKHDNNWFFGEEHKEDGIVVPQALADDSLRQKVLRFFGTLPIALERDGLRVIHACWNEAPIHSAGKIRHEKRVQWWNDYDGPFCVFGHYSILNRQPRGNDSTFCVDYGVGKRWMERQEGKTHDFKLKLAALRWPERVLAFDESTSVGM